MRKIRWEFLVIALAALSMGAGCPLIPQIKDKVVELAVGGSTTAQFDAAGTLNTINKSATINIGDDLDLQGILDDADINVDEVQDIKLSGVSYRMIRPDPEASRAIQNGHLTIRVGAGSETTLINDFDETVNSVTSYKTATLDPAGVAALNGLLDDLLSQLQGGAVADPLTYHLTGTSSPTNVTSDFAWEIKLDVSIVGRVEVTTIE